MLLQNGADVNQLHDGRAPLHESARWGTLYKAINENKIENIVISFLLTSNIMPIDKVN